MTTQYTPEELAHNCQACTLADAMKTCEACQFLSLPVSIPFELKTVSDWTLRSKLIKCEAIETTNGLKIGDRVTHKGIEGKLEPESGYITKIEYWLDYNLSYYRLSMRTDTNARFEAAESFYTKVTTVTPIKADNITNRR